MATYIEQLTWEENRDLEHRATAILVPVGSTEQHGPHLPVNNDAYCAKALACQIAEESDRRGIQVAVSPAVVFGVSGHHMAFSGTISLRPHVFEEVIYDIGASLFRHGWKAVIFVNGHGGNSTSLSSAIAHLADDFPDAIVLLHEWWHLVADRLPEILEGNLCHACEGETSISLALEQRVLVERAHREVHEIASRFFNLSTPDLTIGFPIPPLHRVTRSGVIGDPTKATMEKGNQIVDEVLSRSMLLMKEIAAKLTGIDDLPN